MLNGQKGDDTMKRLLSLLCLMGIMAAFQAK